MTRKTDAWRELQDLWQDTLDDLSHPELLRGRLPPGWAEIEGRPDQEHVRITLRVDRDVARYFRGMGPGYQGRMNRVLRAYMLARLAEIFVPEDLAAKEPGTLPEGDALAREREVLQLLEAIRRDRLGPRLSERLKALRS